MDFPAKMVRTGDLYDSWVNNRKAVLQSGLEGIIFAIGAILSFILFYSHPFPFCLVPFWFAYMSGTKLSESQHKETLYTKGDGPTKYIVPGIPDK